MYKPYIFKVNNNDNNDNNDIVLDLKNSIIISTTINQPLFSLGYHYYLDRTRNDFINYTKVIQSEYKFYYVINPFETNITNYDDNLNNLSNIYFNQDKKTKLNRSFFKLWEMLFMFDLASDKDIKYTSYDTDNGFIQALMFYRDKFGFASKNDKLYNISDNIDNIDIGKKNKHFKTINDINVKNINAFKKDLEKSKTYSNLITCNLNLSNNESEQDSYKLILSEIVCAINSQEKNGSLILRIFDTFTIVTLKMIYILSILYEDVYIYKPYFSRPTSSEKYIVCKKFKNDKKLKKYTDVLEDILTKIDKYVFDILPSISLPISFISQFKFTNIKLVNHQQIMINNIITYIKENNYYGDKFHQCREAQVNASQWWCRMFYPPSNNLYIANKAELSKMHSSTQTVYSKEQGDFLQTIV
jgi:hypothetical protein